MDKEVSTIKELEGGLLSPFGDVGDIFMYDSKNIRIIVHPPSPTTTGKCLQWFTNQTKISFL
jgi:hypothetical protein